MGVQMLKSSLVVALGLLASCTSNRMFAPRESRNGSGPTGMQAAVYALPSPGQGEVRLWCDGARRNTPPGGEAQTELMLGFEIENPGSVPLRLDPQNVHVRAVVSEGGRSEARALLPLPAVAVAEPGTTASLGIAFVIDGGLLPRSVEGFELHWRIEAADGSGSYAQVTPFQTWLPDPPSRYYWRDPWPWWGFGFGYSGYYWCR